MGSNRSIQRLRKYLRRKWDADWSGFWFLKLLFFPIFLLGRLLKRKEKNKINKAKSFSPTSSRDGVRKPKILSPKFGGVIGASSNMLASVLRIQNVFRRKFYRFDRLRLVDRLALESNFISTGVRLVLFSLLFISVALMLDAVYFLDYLWVEELFQDNLSNGTVSSLSEFISSYPPLVQSASILQYMSNSTLLSSDPNGMSFTPMGSTDGYVSGFLKISDTGLDSSQVSAFTLFESDCLRVTSSDVLLNYQNGGDVLILSNIGMNQNLSVSEWLHVGLQVVDPVGEGLSAKVAVLLNGKEVGTPVDSGTLNSTVFESGCYFQHSRVHNVTDLSFSGFSLFAGNFDASDTSEYFPEFGLPQSFLNASTVPGTNMVNTTLVGLEFELPPLVYITPGVFEYSGTYLYPVTQMFIPNVSLNSFELSSAQNFTVRFLQPFLVEMGDVTVSKEQEVIVHASDSSSFHESLFLYELEFDQLGIATEKFYYYLSSDAGWVQFWVSFALNLLLSFTILYMDWYLELIALHGKFRLSKILHAGMINWQNVTAVLVNVVFSVCYFGYMFNGGKNQRALVADLVASLRDPSAVVSLIDDKLAYVADVQKWLSYFGSFLVLYVLLWRVMSCMRFHPRIGLFVATIDHSMSEILHFMVTFFIVASGLSIIGIFTFDYEYDSYTSFQGSLYSLFHTLTGDDWSGIDKWRYSWQGVIFFVLLPLLCIFTLLNFLLAVIIDTYVKVRERYVERNFTHQSIFIELIDIPKSILLYFIFELPNRGALIEQLNGMNNLRILELHNLREALAACNYSDSEGIVKFAQFYHSFEFLKLSVGAAQKRQKRKTLIRSSRKTTDNDGLEIDNELSTSSSSESDSVNSSFSKDDEISDANSRLAFISKRLRDVLVELHLKNYAQNGSKKHTSTSVTNSLVSSNVLESVTKKTIGALTKQESNAKLIYEYQATRDIDRLTIAKVKSRKMKEYLEKARLDAVDIISQTDSSKLNSNRFTNDSRKESRRKSHRSSLIQSLILHDENEPTVPYFRSSSRGSVIGSVVNSYARRPSINPGTTQRQ